jgi:hypothetical protein
VLLVATVAFPQLMRRWGERHQAERTAYHYVYVVLKPHISRNMPFLHKYVRTIGLYVLGLTTVSRGIANSQHCPDLQATTSAIPFVVSSCNIPFSAIV